MTQNNTEMTPEQAELQFASEEFASQITILTQRLARQRVLNAQLSQELRRLTGEVAALQGEARGDEGGPVVLGEDELATT